MKKLILGLMTIFVASGICFAESYLYIEQSKEINGSYKYYIPKLELNTAKIAGVFLGSKCYYLSEIEGGLVYTAPRSNAKALNHSAVEANWNFGVEIKPFFVTYSIGGNWHIAGNNEGIPEGIEMFNKARVGVSWN